MSVQKLHINGKIASIWNVTIIKNAVIKKTMTYKDIQILYEDNHLLVVEKPINLPVQADGSGDFDLLNMLKQYLIEKYNKPGDAYLGLVHRLDRPTGGVMVFAKTSKAADRLRLEKEHGEFEKRYFAVVEGRPRENRGKLINYLKKYPDNVVRIVPALSVDAKYAELDYKVLAVSHDGKRSLLQIELLTGRAHQIRVQLAGIGNPIVGDVKYGKPDGKMSGLTTQLGLWAVQLRFLHPVTQQSMAFIAYPPEKEPWTEFDIESLLAINIKSSYKEDADSYSLDKIGDLDLKLNDDDAKDTSGDDNN